MIAFAAIRAAIGGFAAFKVIVIASTIIAVLGFGYAGCQSQFNKGFQEAEANRLEDIGKENVETAIKLKEDYAASRSAEQKYRLERDNARDIARKALIARNAMSVEGGKICAPGCTYSP